VITTARLDLRPFTAASARAIAAASGDGQSWAAGLALNAHMCRGHRTGVQRLDHRRADAADN
jgi:hypothetical protein